MHLLMNINMEPLSWLLQVPPMWIEMWEMAQMLLIEHITPVKTRFLSTPILLQLSSPSSEKGTDFEPSEMFILKSLTLHWLCYAEDLFVLTH